MQRLRNVFVPAVLWAGLWAVFYASFLSRDYIGDGVRWLHLLISARSMPEIDLMQHPIFARVAWLWYQGIKGMAEGVEPVTLFQLGNAVCGGLGIGLFFYFIQSIVRSFSISFVVSAFLGFSAAYHTHATDMTEIMPGFPFVMLTFIFALEAGKKENIFLACLSAVTAIFSTALFLSNIFSLIPAAALIVFQAPHQRVRLLVAFGLTAALAFPFMCLAPLGYLSWNPVTTFEHVQEQLHYTHLGVMTSGFTLTRLASSILGWAGALAGLREFTGGFDLIRNISSTASILNLGVFIFFGGLTLWFLFRMGKKWFEKSSYRVFFIAGVLWFMSGFMFTWYFAPVYHKLWIFPLSGFYFLIACGLGFLRENSGWKRPVILWLFIFGAGLIPLNFFGYIYPRHAYDSPYVKDARSVAEEIGRDGMLVMESFDRVSVYAEAFHGVKVFSVFIEGGFVDFEFGPFKKRFLEEVAATEKRKGRIYFLQLFEPQMFDRLPGILSARRGIDFSFFEAYRKKSKPVLELPSLTSQEGYPVYLWRLESGEDV